MKKISSQLASSNLIAFLPSWTLCRERTLSAQAGSPDSCSHSGPPALRNTLSRSQPRPPEAAAAPPLTPPSWSRRRHTLETLSGTLVRVTRKKKELKSKKETAGLENHSQQSFLFSVKGDTQGSACPVTKSIFGIHAREGVMGKQ